MLPILRYASWFGYSHGTEPMMVWQMHWAIHVLWSCEPTREIIDSTQVAKKHLQCIVSPRLGSSLLCIPTSLSKQMHTKAAGEAWYWPECILWFRPDFIQGVWFIDYSYIVAAEICVHSNWYYTCLIPQLICHAVYKPNCFALKTTVLMLIVLCTMWTRYY